MFRVVTGKLNCYLALCTLCRNTLEGLTVPGHLEADGPLAVMCGLFCRGIVGERKLCRHWTAPRPQSIRKSNTQLSSVVPSSNNLPTMGSMQLQVEGGRGP